jgi:pimeloyl-ACP methyl ester carboxylesterase
VASVQPDPIVLIHGIATISPVMWLLRWRLNKAGFPVFYWSYGSLFRSIEEHSHRLADYLTQEQLASRRFHIVAHSMGSIVCRSTMAQFPLPHLHRVVWLAPPNGGSPIARVASSILGKVVIPTRELSDAPTSFVNKLPKPRGENLGIIAAKYDLLVPEAKTRLINGEAFQSLHATHNSLLFSKRVVEMIARFLRTGEF